jgi:redox-regulated HSP33 family molecular chaperone
MAEVDTLRRFLFERYPFRGQLVHLGPAWLAMMEHHDYPPNVRNALGEAVAATALLSSMHGRARAARSCTLSRNTGGQRPARVVG